MTLQEIIKKFKKKSWLRMCALHKIDKWELIDFLQEPVYASRYLIKEGLEVNTRVCLRCAAPLQLGIYKESFTVKVSCSCRKDNTHNMTIDKLACVLNEDKAILALSLVHGARCKSFSNTVQYWQDKGYSIDDAKENISRIQKTRSEKSPASKKGVRGYSSRTIEYWVARGFSQNDAKEKVRQVQTTNGLAFYNKKYGDAGESLFNARIYKWLNSEGNKNMNANRSKKSIELFDRLGVGDYGSNEKTIRGATRVHRVDFIYHDKIIEYYGDYWHGNPLIFSGDDMIRKKRVSDVWEHDRKKVQDLRDKGYSVLIIWERDYTETPDAVIQQCMEFIK